MTIERSTVAAVAHLARIGVDQADLELLAERVDRILGLVDRMQQIDTTSVEPMHHPLDAVQRLRADAVTETDQRDELQALAPASEQGLYLVPRVIE
jgi:aspartyl-tRNA(Asn)/glutamyl-tRNA(Gln) amidotransferase subunit C